MSLRQKHESVMEEKEIKIALVDDHALFRNGLRGLIDGNHNCRVVAEASDGAEFLECKEAMSADVVFMDPPRAGSDKRFLSSVVTLNPERVVYISCNPETLARDLDYFIKKGYTVKKICPVDMFPHTNHIECVVLLCR
mgnify:CR=1 FL=1